MFEKVRKKISELSRDIAIDFGSASVLVYVEGEGIVLKEPSVIAIDTTTDRVVRVGQDAMEMLGRTPENIKAVRPLSDGSISEYDVTLQMLKYFIRRSCGKLVIPPRVMICVPTGINDVSKRAVMDAAREAGARKTYLIEEPMAAAIGAGLDVTSPVGSMVVNIGGGISEVAVLSMGGIVTVDPIRVGGDNFDQAIISYVRRRYGVLIGSRTAEDIKTQIGEVYEHRDARYMKVVGRSLSGGLPQEIVISSKEMIEAQSEPITAILDSICSVVENTPPDLVGDVLKNGMVLTGGGSMLRGLDLLIERVTGIPTRVARKPVSSTVLGAGKMLKYIKHMPEGMVRIPADVMSGGAEAGALTGR